jgi:L-alanine-DL-glutamate epimerase-like enolase superfamily enzyme
VPLHRLLADRYSGGRLPDKVFCYVGGGWYRPGQTVADLQDEMRRHLDAGYTMVKMKVGGMPVAEDCRRIEAVLEVLGNEVRLAVDANGKFARGEALAYAKALRPFGLKWLEEPCHPLDYALYAEIAAAYDAPLATGENLYSTQDVENLVRFGGLRAGRDFIQVDPPQAYGIAQYGATVAMLEGMSWNRCSLFPHGGNQMSLAIAAGFGLGGAESYPGVFGAFGGFADDATVEDGFLSLSDRPGIGFEGQAALYALMRPLAE